MANKDVNLTITARNAATKTIKSVGDALKDMRTAQKQANAENTGGTQSVKNMAGAYGELVGQVRRLKAIADVSKNVNSAAAAVERLGAANKNLATDQKKVADNLAKAKVETDAVRASQKGVNAELAVQNAALAEAKALKTQMKKDLVQEERLYKKISTAAAKAQQGDGFGQPAIKSAELFQADNVGDQRIALMKVQATIDNLTNSTKKLKTEQSALTTTSSKATAAETKLNGEYTKLTGTLQANTRALAEGRAELDRIQDAAARLGVAGGMGDLVANQEKLKVATREVTAEMERLGSVQAALNRFDAGGANFTDPKTAAAIKAQREEINKARVAYELLTAEHTRLSASARAVLAPQSAAAKAAREVGNAAAAAKRELADQIEVMNRIPGSAGNIGKSLNGLFRGYNTEGRTALSLTQRIRAEVISLALAYGGLHEAIRLMSEVVDAYRTMEAATNRIMVVVEGDTRRTADELGFLSRMASRLGVDFGVLSDEYSKFAVAANSAGYSMESTRKIFTAVSEAGRVNKLSTEQMSGAFLAFTQIIQKGKFSAEEVTRQLSERLPGATAILAKAMFGSADAVDQLFDAMKKGELLATEENLLKYADGLNEKFGPQLSKSLRTTTTLIGQFTNELFQAKLRIGEGGFIDALNVALEEMITYFKSREGRDFFLAIGAGMGKVVEMVPFLVQNFDTIINLIKTFVAFKMAQWLFNTALAFTALGRETLKMRTMMGLAVTSMKTGEGAMYSLGRAAHATRAALLAIPGGLAIAAITTGISYLMGNWSAGVTEINSGVDEHQRIMGEILKAYEDAKDKAGEWKEALPDTVDGEDLAANFVRQLATAERDFTDLVNNGFQVGLSRKNFFSDISGQVRDEIFAMTAELKKTGDLDAYITKLEELAATTANLKMREVVIGLIDTAQEAKSSSERMGEAAVAANEYGVEIDGVAEAAEKFGRTLEDMTVAAEANVAALDDSGEKAEKYAELMDEVGSKIKGVAEELELLSEIKALDEMLVQLVANANGLDEVAAAFLRVRAAQDQLRTDAIVVPSADSFESEYVRRAAAGSGSKEEELVRAVTALAEKMGVAAEDLLTAISYETGGDPTNTRAGSNNVTSQGKHFGLIQFGDGPGAAGERYGVTRDSSITEQVIAAGNYLSDAGIKAGDGLKRIYAAINTGTPDGGGRTDENNGGAPGTSDEKVDNQMEGHRNRAKGLLAAYGGLVQEVEDLAEAEKDAAEDRAKVLEDGRASTAETIAEGAFAIEQQDLINAGKDRQAAIEDAIRSAKAEDPAISEAELASITAQTAALYDKENALTAEEARKKKIEEVDKALNDLESQRNSLIQQRDALKAQGDIAGANEIDSEIVAITAALDAAYDAAVKFWEALGGEGSLAAIEALKASKLEIVATGQAALFTAEELNTSIADGLTSTLSAGMSKLAQYFTDFQAYQEEGVSVFQAMRTAFLQFAADFLIKIGQMIVKQLILNALKSALGGATGGVGGLIAGAIGKVLHTGGIAGAAGGTSRSVSPANYIGASRYHGGGIAGLKPDEVPAILQKGEEVLTANDDRHRKNGGGKNGTRPMRIVNAIDGPSFLEAALGDTAGEEIFINKVRSMKSAIKAALEV